MNHRRWPGGGVGYMSAHFSRRNVGQLLLASPASVVSRKLTTRAFLASLTSLNRLRFSDYVNP